MAGFFVGALALIALEALTEDKAAARLGSAGDIAATFVRRLISPGFAGIPQRKSK